MARRGGGGLSGRPVEPTRPARLGEVRGSVQVVPVGVSEAGRRSERLLAPVDDEHLSRLCGLRPEQGGQLFGERPNGIRQRRLAEPEKHGGCAVRAAHVVNLTERLVWTEGRSGQPEVAPERLGIDGHRLGDAAHPHRDRRRRFGDQRLEMVWVDHPAVHGERRRDGGDHGLSGRWSLRRVNGDVIVGSLDPCDRAVDRHRAGGQSARQPIDETDCAVGEPVGRRHHRPVEASNNPVGRDERVAGGPLIVNRQPELVDQTGDALLAGPEPGGAQVGVPAGYLDGPNSASEGGSGLEHPDGATCPDQPVGDGQAADARTDDDEVDVAHRAGIIGLGSRTTTGQHCHPSSRSR